MPPAAMLIASAVTLAQLEAKLREAGENPEDILLERIPDGAFMDCGSKLS